MITEAERSCGVASLCSTNLLFVFVVPGPVDLLNTCPATSLLSACSLASLCLASACSLKSSPCSWSAKSP